LANGLGNLVARVVGLAKKIGNWKLPEINKPQTTDNFEFQTQLDKANTLVNEADGIISTAKIWEDPAGKASELQKAVSNLLQAIRLLEPFMPETAVEIHRQLNTLDSKPLFPRLG